MSNLHNEEIQAIRNTVTLLRKRYALESNQRVKEEIKKDINECESLIEVKLNECPDYASIRIEEDIY